MLQSLHIHNFALIEDLHRQGKRVHLVCLDNFSSALPLMRHVERAWPLPGARLMADMDKDWRSAAARLLEYARAIRAGLVAAGGGKGRTV